MESQEKRRAAALSFCERSTDTYLYKNFLKEKQTWDLSISNRGNLYSLTNYELSQNVILCIVFPVTLNFRDPFARWEHKKIGEDVRIFVCMCSADRLPLRMTRCQALGRS